MTAKIIHIADFRQFTQPVTKAPRPRRLYVSDRTASVLADINRGHMVTDLGQLDKATRRVLKRLVDKGYVVRDKDYTFPNVKTCYYGAVEPEIEF